jgi:hypothetical protein
MGKTSHPGDAASHSPAPSGRSREQVFRDMKLAIAQNSSYGREKRVQGFNPYDCDLGRPQRDVWGGKRPAR